MTDRTPAPPALAPARRRSDAGSRPAHSPAGRRLVAGSPAGSNGKIVGTDAGSPPALMPVLRRYSAGSRADEPITVPAAGCLLARPPAHPPALRRPDAGPPPDHSPAVRRPLAGSPPAVSRLSPALISILARMVDAKLAADASRQATTHSLTSHDELRSARGAPAAD